MKLFYFGKSILKKLQKMLFDIFENYNVGVVIDYADIVSA